MSEFRSHAENRKCHSSILQLQNLCYFAEEVS